MWDRYGRERDALGVNAHPKKLIGALVFFRYPTGSRYSSRMCFSGLDSATSLWKLMDPMFRGGGRGSLQYPTLDFARFVISLVHLIGHLIMRFEGRDWAPPVFTLITLRERMLVLLADWSWILFYFIVWGDLKLNCITLGNVEALCYRSRHSLKTGGITKHLPQITGSY